VAGPESNSGPLLQVLYRLTYQSDIHSPFKREPQRLSRTSPHFLLRPNDQCQKQPVKVLFPSTIEGQK
jgi:hypothetical protein